MKELNNSAKKKLSIIIPVYNEAQFIDTVIKRVKSVSLPGGIDKEIVIIDDGSVDETGKILEKYNADPLIKIFYRENNQGKTSAVNLGVEISTGDIILIQDADLEYNPEDFPRLIEPIINSKSSIVYGSRFKGLIRKMRTINKLANIISNLTVNLLYNANLSDVNTCYKVFKKEVLKNIRLTSREFTFETEITAKLLKSGYQIYEVPINYVARSKEEGKKITWFKAIKMYWGIIRYKFEDKL